MGVWNGVNSAWVFAVIGGVGWSITRFSLTVGAVGSSGPKLEF